MRTAPAPNIPAIPGMNPGMFVAAGGGGGGGGSGDGGDGSGDGEGGQGQKGGNDAKGGGKNAKGCGAGSGSGCPNPAHGGKGTTAGDPVDVTTGRVYTIAAPDLILAGPMPFVVFRTYDSSKRDRDVGLGFGWSHSLAWEVQIHRRRMHLITGEGIEWDFPILAVGEETQIEDLLIRREFAAVMVTQGRTGLTYRFEPFVVPADPATPSTGTHVLTSIFDAYDNGLRLAYERGFLIGVFDTANRLVRVRRNGARIAAFEISGVPGTAWFAVRTYEHDARGDLVTARDPYGNPNRYTYDDDHRLTSQSTPEGVTTFYRYDAKSRCFETWCERSGGDPSLDESAPKLLADGATRAKGFLHCKIDYGDDYAEVVTSRGVRRYFMNGAIAEKTVFGTGVHESQYDGLGNLVRYLDPLGAEWNYTYDARGRRTSEKNPLGDVLNWIYDEHGHLVRMAFPGGERDYVRNAQGDLLLASDTLGPIVSYEYDARGLITRADTPAGTTLMEYDSMGNRTRIVEPNGGQRRFTYDALGLITSVVDENGHESRYVYGPGRELLAVQTADGATVHYRYNRDGQLVGISTPLGRYELLWGGAASCCEVRKPDGTALRFRYDREGNLVRVIDERGDDNVFTRDSEGRVVREKTFDGRVKQYEVDALGRLVKIDVAGEVTQIAYDALDRIVKRVLPDESEESFTYDWAGRVLTADNGLVRTEFAYDSRGRRIEETQSYAGSTESIESRYGAVGRIEMRTSRGHVERMRLNAMSLATELQLDGATAPVRFAWDGADQEIERILPGGAAVRRRYDPAGRVAARALYAPGARPNVGPLEPEWMGPNPGLLLQQSFAYEPACSLPTHSDDSARGPVEFKNDPMGQILSRTPAAGLAREVFSYRHGEELVDGGAMRHYMPGGRLVKRSNTDYRYDDAHRLVEKRGAGEDAGPGWRYEWNGSGLLAAAISPKGERIENVYDAFARRVEKRVKDRDGATVSSVRYVWDSGSPIHEIKRRAQSTNDPIVEERTYAYAPKKGWLLAHRDVKLNGHREESGWVFYVNDATGRPEHLVDERGKSLATFDTKAFGALEPVPNRPNDVATSARFMGHWEDEETGLFYNRYRFYDPETGRYMSPEPLGIQGGFSTFGYARNRPFDYVDLDGLAPEEGMLATGPNGTRGSSSNEDNTSAGVRSGEDDPEGRPLHPVVANALADPSCVRSRYGGMRDPAACAEPRHLSDYLHNYEPEIDPNDPEQVRTALMNYKVQANQANNGKPRAPCANCSQMFANLIAQYGAPPEGNITPGGRAANSPESRFTRFSRPSPTKYPKGAPGGDPNERAYTSYAQAQAEYDAGGGQAARDRIGGGRAQE